MKFTCFSAFKTWSLTEVSYIWMGKMLA